MNHGLDFAGKIVVVTGAASGIGRATATLIRDLGGQVLALDLLPVDLQGVRAVPVDLGNRAAIDAAVRAIGAGPVDALCNIAGVPSGCGLAGADIAAINYLGTRYLTERLVPQMSRGGSIVCVSSGAARFWADRLDEVAPLVALADYDDARGWLRGNTPSFEPYGFAKQGVNQWALGAAPALLRGGGLRINLVAPGLIDTQMPRHSNNGSFEELVAGFTRFAERIGQPIDVAWPVAFLASSAAAFVNGQVIDVDGGMMTIAARDAARQP